MISQRQSVFLESTLVWVSHSPCVSLDFAVSSHYILQRWGESQK